MSAGRRRMLVALAAVGVAIAFPFIVPRSVVGSANVGAAYAMVALSLVLLTGWVGQISLGQAALVGVGGYATGYATGWAEIPFPLSLPFAAAAAGGIAALLGLVALRVRGLYLAVATLVFNWMASEFLFRQRWFTKYNLITDLPSGSVGWLPRFDFTDRRVFYLVAWAIVAAAVLGAANVRDSKTGRAFFAVRGSEMAAASLGIDVMRTKLLAFACSGALAGAAGNLLMSDARVVSPDQFTFNVSLFYLAMAVVGGLRSLGGAIAAALVFAGLTEVFFRVPALGGFLELVSGLLLAITLLAYKGGLASFAPKLARLGEVFSAAVRDWMRPEPEEEEAAGGRRAQRARPGTMVRRGTRVAGKFIASGPVLRLPGARALSTRLEAFAARPVKAPVRRPGHGAPRRRIDLDTLLGVSDGGTSPEASASPMGTGASEGVAPVPSAPSNGHGARPAGIEAVRARAATAGPIGDRELRAPVIEAEGVVVRFGGLTAVNDASLTVREGEIVGLIGPNGAGKTTLFNAIAGFNSPAAGSIRVFGQDVTGLPVHLRAQVGVARTFQAIQLFRELTVFENLLVATHVDNPSGFRTHLLASEAALSSERAARKRVHEILALLDMTNVESRRAADLPFGVLRMVEVARAMVTGFPVMMLDEPASGLDNNETDRLMEVLRFVRGLGITQLLIEHDVRMVTGVSDYIYVLDQGRIIATGPPEAIQRDPAVVAAYLGQPVGAESEPEAVNR